MFKQDIQNSISRSSKVNLIELAVFTQPILFE